MERAYALARRPWPNFRLTPHQALAWKIPGLKGAKLFFPRHEAKLNEKNFSKRFKWGSKTIPKKLVLVQARIGKLRLEKGLVPPLVQGLKALAS